MPTGLMDAFCKDACTAIGKFIAIDRSDYHMLQFQMPHSLTEPTGFIKIDALRLPFRNCTKHAPTGTDITQDHEGGGSAFPALTNIGTLCLLADGV